MAKINKSKMACNKPKRQISGGKKLLTKTINLRTVESEIAKPLKEVQENSII